MNSNGFEFIGYGFGSTGNGGAGAFNQTGGPNTINGDSLYLGYYVGSTGSYTLSNGSLAVGGNTGFEYLGYGAQTTGTFTQSGGTNNSVDLFIGYGAGSNGTYTLNAGSLTQTFEEIVGYNGAGSFTQNGGTHTVTNGFLSIAIT